MNGATIGLIIITILSVGVIVVIGPYIRKITNCWYFWIYIGILFLIYVIICRFGSDWHNLNQYFKNKVTTDLPPDIIISKGLLLDICPFVCVSLLIAIICDPTRRFAQIIAPFGLFGGLITICGLNSNDDPSFNMHWIFEGEHPNELYFMMHYIMVIVSTLVLASTPRFKTFSFFKKQKIWQKININHWFFSLAFAIFYYSYVAICMTQLNVSQNVSGLNMNDWDGGEYSGVAQVFNCSPQVAAAIGFSLSIIVISLLIFAFGTLQETKKYHLNMDWNKKNWWYEKTYLI